MDTLSKLSNRWAPKDLEPFMGLHDEVVAVFEAKEKKLHLADEDPKIFDEIRGYSLSEIKDEDLKEGDSNLSFWHLSPTTLKYVYDATPPGSVLRSILVDILVWQVDFCRNPGLADAPPEFLYEALKVCEMDLPLFPRKGDKVAPYFENKAVCKNYHTHKSSKECEQLEESKK
ncbi:MAG: hypothetical protein Q9213_005642 [Squamulea squamosa]